MVKYDLKTPIEINGTTIASVTIRQPKGRDMVEVGDDFATLARFYAANARAITAAMEQAAAAGAEDAAAGKDAPDYGRLAGIDAAAITPADASIYKAMIAVAGQMTGIGDGAAELSVPDLTEIATRAFTGLGE